MWDKIWTHTLYFVWRTCASTWVHLFIEPDLPNLSRDKQVEKMQKRITEFVLKLYRAGYGPTVIAEALIMNSIAFVAECGGPDANTQQFDKPVEEIVEILRRESGRRMMMPPTDRVGQFIQRNSA
jgi:hypothetical protein